MKKSLKENVLDTPRFSRRNLLIFIIAMIPVGYFLLVSRAAPPPPPTIYLTPETKTLASGGTVTYEVRANSGTTQVNAVQANISYPANLVDYVSFDATGSGYGTGVQEGALNGVIYIARGVATPVSGQTVPLTGDQLVGKITLRAKTVGGSANLSFTTGTALVSSTTNVNILPSLASTGGSALTVDVTPPSVSITAPANSAVLSGGTTYTISANATDNASGISKVEVYVDGALKTTLTASPYNYSWSTTGLALGAHTIYAKATDGIGLVTTSTTVTVTLADQTAPTVSITAPTSNATITGLYTMTANSSDNSGGTGVNRVEFFVDNVLKSTDTTSPYSYTWDSKTVTDGVHSITAKSYDNATPANIGTSSAVSVNVDNADKTPPSQPGNFRMTSNTTSSISLAWDASTDNIGVVGYKLKRDGVDVSTANVTTFVDNGRTAGQSYTYTLTAYDAAGNNSTVATVTASAVALKPGDLDGNGVVELYDLSLLLGKWGQAFTAYDINKNGTVDVFDLSILLDNYGK